MSMSNADIAKNVKESLKLVKIAGTDGIRNGKDFYKFFFTNFPDLRKYFKGVENYTADDIEKSERFEKQGQRLLLAVHILANSIDEEDVFRAYARETVNRHRIYKMDPALWAAFFDVYVAFLGTKGDLNADQKAAWAQMAKIFDEECQIHLKNLGLPHV
ncbi:unnamed protein product [Auanema sp. JU1783]|nr:unnamed protein product [Auanema sp. JU1783]